MTHTSPRYARAAFVLAHATAVAVFIAVVSLQAQQPAPGSAPRRSGILLLAHGGSTQWDANVADLAAATDATAPTEVALGMATRANIQRAVDRLQARGVTEIVAVPLFVSSHSTVITATEYLLGLRAEMPPALLAFAKMSHGSDAGHAGHAAEDGTTPVTVRVPIRMTPALDAHPLVADIVESRAREISRAPAEEAVVLVAHGPTTDATNDLWVKNLRVIAAAVRARTAFAAIDALTVRDDAPAPIRDAATRELRVVVSGHLTAGRRVLIVPVLLSYGGIEGGIRTRLEGLDVAIASRGLAPDTRLVEWVRAMAAGR